MRLHHPMEGEEKAICAFERILLTVLPGSFMKFSLLSTDGKIKATMQFLNN